MFNSKLGICNQAHITSAQVAKMHELLKAKGWHSGDRDYPIAHPSSDVPAIRAYISKANLWDESCPYCQRRITIYKELMACSTNAKVEHLLVLIDVSEQLTAVKTWVVHHTTKQQQGSYSNKRHHCRYRPGAREHKLLRMARRAEEQELLR